MADPTVILDIEPDWSESPSLDFSFLTAFQDTPYFEEQRRPLFPSAVRTANYTFVESDAMLQRLRNTLLAAKSSLICVPIFSEPITAGSIIFGGSSITATTTLTYLWNIQNCSYVVLIDIVTGQSEMLGVASVSGQLIRFTTNITKTWVATQTIIYPAFAATLKAVKEANILSKTASIDAEFEETALGGEATEEWVGLGEQICFGEPSLLIDWIDRSYGNYATFENVAGYGDVLHLNAWSQIYVGSFGANAEANYIFQRFGSLVVEFDYFHGEDYWYDDDLTDSRFYFGVYPNTIFTIPQTFWGYAVPSPATGIFLHMRSLSTARVTLSTSNLGVIANPSLTGLHSGLYASNFYRMYVDWPGHTISVWVNGTLVIDAVSFGSGLDALFGDTVKILFHQNSYSYTFANRYIKNFKITR